MSNTFPEKELRGILRTVERFSGQGAVYQGLNDSNMLANKKLCKFCELCLHHPATAHLCRSASCNAVITGLASGEPSFQRCWAGLMFVAVPIAPKNRCCGGISVGGYYSEGEGDETRQALDRTLSALRIRDVGHFMDQAGQLGEITPVALRGLGHFLLEATFASGLNSPAFFKTQNDKYIQQRRIAEAIGDIKSLVPTESDILGETYQLMFFLDRNDRESAMRFVSKYLAKLLMASHWNLTHLKAHLRVLLAVMTSRDILDGRDWSNATSRELMDMIRLEEARTTEDSCYEAAAVIMRYFRGQGEPVDEGGSVSERAVAWLQSHYHEPVTLAAASRAVGASVSSIVQNLKKTTGRTSRSILNEIRISQAKKLMATTDMKTSVIAQLCGFTDQSHLTRTMKNVINLTPGKFRRLLHFGKAEILEE